MSEPDLEERIGLRIDKLEEALGALHLVFGLRLDDLERTKPVQKTHAAPSLVENLKHAFEALRDASKADKVTAFMKRDALHLDAQMTLRNVLISLGVTPEELQ